MKKKLLFVIPSLDAGGAEKSLINLLTQFDFQKYEVDLFLFKNAGLFLNSLPSEVKIIAHPKSFAIFNLGLVASCLQYVLKANFRLFIARIQFFLTNRLVKNKAISEQKSWKYICKSIPTLDTKYDCAISYLEKSSLYFVVDKVNSLNKIAYIHNDYNKLGLDKNFDKPFFNQLDSLVTVSEECSKVLKILFPDMMYKVNVMYNIISEKLIQELAERVDSIEIEQNTLSILSIGRLHPQKGFDMAIKACEMIKEKGIDIKWFIIGEGSERGELENKIKKFGLSQNFFLLGLRDNPYSYMKKALIYVQPSRYEGKSIAVDEAKILKKPIVVTNFSTAKDQICSGENGIITDMNPKALANAILQLIENRELMDKFSLNLSHEKLGTEDQIYKLYALIDAAK